MAGWHQRGFSLSALARSAGIWKSTLSDMECGRGNRHDQGAVEFYLVELDAGTRRDAVAHSSEVIGHVIVMSGRVHVGPEGQSELLEPGDSMQFPADVPHPYHAVDGTVRLLAMHCY